MLATAPYVRLGIETLLDPAFPACMHVPKRRGTDVPLFLSSLQSFFSQSSIADYIPSRSWHARIVTCICGAYCTTNARLQMLIGSAACFCKLRKPTFDQVRGAIIFCGCGRKHVCGRHFGLYLIKQPFEIEGVCSGQILVHACLVAYR